MDGKSSPKRVLSRRASYECGRNVVGHGGRDSPPVFLVHRTSARVSRDAVRERGVDSSVRLLIAPAGYSDADVLAQGVSTHLLQPLGVAAREKAAAGRMSAEPVALRTIGNGRALVTTFPGGP